MPVERNSHALKHSKAHPSLSFGPFNAHVQEHFQ